MTTMAVTCRPLALRTYRRGVSVANSRGSPSTDQDSRPPICADMGGKHCRVWVDAQRSRIGYWLDCATKSGTTLHTSEALSPSRNGYAVQGMPNVP
jgi:hypothetical protein